MTVWMVWIWAVGTAGAHVPHDGALFVASWPGGGRPLVTSIYRDSGIMLSRVGETPTDVQSRFLAPQKSDVRGVVFGAADRLLAAVAAEGLWVSEDLGDTWTSHPDLASDPLVAVVSASPLVHVDGVVLAAGGAGIWRSADGGSTWALAQETADAVDRLSWSDPSGSAPQVCALTGLTQILCSSDQGETWALEARSPQSLTDIAVGPDGALWGASEAGLLRRSDGVWSGAGLEGDQVRYVMLLDDGTALATRDEEAVWRSENDGQSWTLGSDGLPTNLSGIGAPRDGIYYRQLIQEVGGRVLLATWSGLYVSDDRGLTWTGVETEMPWVTRSIDLAASSTGAPWVFIGKYGGGTTLVRADGTEPQAVGADMPVRFSRSISAGAGVGEAQVLLVTDFGAVSVSQDGGLVWTTYSGEDWYELGYVDVEDAVSETPLALLAGDVLDGSTFSRSEDGGLTWTPTTVSEGCLGGRRVLDLPPDWDAQPEAWAGCRTDGALYVSHDRGLSWEALGALAPPWLMQVKGLPGESAAYAATTEGLYRVGTDGSAELVAFGGDQISSLGVSRGWATDGTAFVLVAGVGWYRTTDHGETWSSLPRPTLAHGEAMEVSPEFPVDQSLAVGTYDGTWASQDAGETWTQVTGVDRIEDDHGLWRFGAGWVASLAPGPSGGTHTEGPWRGLTAEVAFEGVGFDLIGRTGPGEGALTVFLDGGEAVSLNAWSEETAQQVVLWKVRGLDPGPHALQIEVVSAPVALDAVLAWYVDPDVGDTPVDTAPDSGLTDSEPIDSGPADTGVPTDSGGSQEGCGGCAATGNGRSGAWLLLLGLALARRVTRRRASAERGG